MSLFFIIGTWFVFILLCFFVFISGSEGKLDVYTNVFRKIWYLIFIFGFLVYITKNGVDLLFYDWEKFLIILVVFIVIDALLFLELHFIKLGGQELKSARVQVGVTQEELDAAERKAERVANILISFEFIMYNLDNKKYITQLERLLSRYAKEENLVVDLLPFETIMEQEKVLANLAKERSKVSNFLSKHNSISLRSDSLALYPFKLLNYGYVVRLQTLDDDDKITKVDGTVITTLIVAYNLTVNDNTRESGE